MNDCDIRAAFYRKRLSKHDNDPKTIIVNELGLNHGQNRADIAIINGRLTGYEIKSDSDSLRRLNQQIIGYDEIFDSIYLITTERHVKRIETILPEWWGIIMASEGKRGAIHFKKIRSPKTNLTVDDYAVAKLLWRTEAQEILGILGVTGRRIRENRDKLYSYIVAELKSKKLRKTVRDYLMRRSNWRRPPQLFPSDG